MQHARCVRTWLRNNLGGMMGFGPIVPEKDEPVFHTSWEKRAMAVTLAMGVTGSWPLDAGPPALYFVSLT